MSPQNNRKPPSGITQIPVECDRFDSCPHGNDLHDLKNDMRIVKTALIGDIETQRPGMIDDIRSLKAAHKKNESGKKRWIGIAFGAIGAFAASAGAWAWTQFVGK